MRTIIPLKQKKNDDLKIIDHFSSTQPTVGKRLILVRLINTGFNFHFVTTFTMSKNRQEIPFAAQWILKENELKVLKNSVNGCLHSSYDSTLTRGIEYCLQIYPNGNRRENRGKCMVNFGVKMGDHKQIDAKYTVLVESANRSQDVTHTFKETNGWGKLLCDTSDFYDPKKQFIVDGKMVLKVYGIFEIDEKQFLYIETFGNELWKNDESKDFKIVVEGKEIKVHKLILATVSPVFAEMLKSKEAIENGQMKISNFSYDVIDFAMKNIYGCYRLNANISSNAIMSVVQFYDKYDIHYLRERFIKFLFRRHGMPLKDNEIFKRQNDGGRVLFTLGFKLWENDESKDFKLIVEGKELKVHKLILSTRSPKFDEMFKTKEDTDQIEIPDFTHNLVEIALKKIYGCCDILHSDEEMMAMLQFLEKYDFHFLKKILEIALIRHLSISNVCLLTNCSIASNATKLKKKCLEFLKIAVAAKISLPDIKVLDKQIASNILQNPLYHTLETQRK